MHKSAEEVRSWPALELTNWQAYIEVLDWMRKAESNEPEKVWSFARSVNEIFEERLADRKAKRNRR